MGALFLPTSEEKKCFYVTVEIPHNGTKWQPICAIMCTQPCHTRIDRETVIYCLLTLVFDSRIVCSPAVDSFHLDNIIYVLLRFLSIFCSLSDHCDIKDISMLSLTEIINFYTHSILLMNICVKYMNIFSVTSSEVSVDRNKYVLRRYKPTM